MVRRANPDREYVELRPKVQRAVADVLDAEAISMAKDQDRIVSRDKLVVQVLTEWAARRHRQASLILTVAGLNPIEVESDD